MDIGVNLGVNVPSGVVALHALVGVFFLYIAGANAAGGELVGAGLNAVIGLSLVAVGVIAGRITARR
ncbi:MAG: hypothetical protein ACI9TI_000060 [Natronomonas sp.]|jgi:hypothetical protein|uniref:hypothetical protein n=1 Tax=Natronomonas sp. TaxID=2184060 RepID=UPI003988B51E